MKQMKIV